MKLIQRQIFCHCDSFNPTSQSSLLPPLISSYYKPESLSLALSDRILESQILFAILFGTNEQAKCLEEINKRAK